MQDDYLKVTFHGLQRQQQPQADINRGNNDLISALNGAMLKVFRYTSGNAVP